MEFLNKVELKGIVGKATTTITPNGGYITKFSLVTERTTESEDGALVVETTWFQCTTHNEIAISKGDHAHVLGRLRIRKYTDQDGAERVIYEVVVDSVTILDK